ncbi:MAG TPA: BON domain-containing protein, partial [Verrucomicrobiae bacterium]|nr:BON domain-containing protein [Verrucomicrobiae bacterium]
STYGTTGIPLSPQAEYLHQGLFLFNPLKESVSIRSCPSTIGLTPSISRVDVFDTNGINVNSTAKYQVLYDTLLWAYEYDCLNRTGGVNYNSIVQAFQPVVTGQWLGDVGSVLATVVNDINISTWVDTLVQGTISQISRDPSAQDQETKFVDTIAALSKGYPQLVYQVNGNGNADKILKAIDPQGCFLAGAAYNASQVAIAFSAKGSNAGDIAKLIFEDLGIPVSSLRPGVLNFAKGVLQNFAQDQLTAGLSLLVDASAYGVTNGLMAYFLAQFSARDALVATGAGFSQALSGAVDFAQFDLLLEVAKDINQYSLQQANLIQERNKLANLAVVEIPSLNSLATQLYTSGYADVGAGETAADAEGLINAQVSLAYQLDYELISNGIIALVSSSRLQGDQAAVFAYGQAGAQQRAAEMAASAEASQLANIGVNCFSSIGQPSGGNPSQPVTQAPMIRKSNAGDRKGVRTDAHVPDEAIIGNINNNLFKDPALRTREILVTAQKGVVTLVGTVNTPAEKAAAERIAKSTAGVQRVINQLRISASSR